MRRALNLLCGISFFLITYSSKSRMIKIAQLLLVAAFRLRCLQFADIQILRSFLVQVAGSFPLPLHFMLPILFLLLTMALLLQTSREGLMTGFSSNYQWRVCGAQDAPPCDFSSALFGLAPDCFDKDTDFSNQKKGYQHILLCALVVFVPVSDLAAGTLAESF